MSLRRSKRSVIKNNAANGKSGERRVRDRYERVGCNVERTGHGNDFDPSQPSPYDLLLKFMKNPSQPSPYDLLLKFMKNPSQPSPYDLLPKCHRSRLDNMI